MEIGLSALASRSRGWEGTRQDPEEAAFAYVNLNWQSYGASDKPDEASDSDSSLTIGLPLRARVPRAPFFAEPEAGTEAAPFDFRAYQSGLRV